MKMKATTTTMQRARWIASRLAASLTGALLVGLAAALIMTLIQVLTCGSECTTFASADNGPDRCIAYSSTCSGWLDPLFFYAFWAPVFSVPLGALPGLVALTLSPAKHHPWRALPVLVLSTLVGFGLWLVLAWIIKYDYPGAFGAVALFVIPSATGLAVAWNINRLPKPFRLVNGN